MTRRRFSASALKARLDEFGGACVDCGMLTGGPAGLEWDHRIPLALGGDDDLPNLEPRCRGCHKAKTATDKRHIAKAKRMQQRQVGIGRQTRNPLPGSKASGLRKRMDGTVERR